MSLSWKATIVSMAGVLVVSQGLAAAAQQTTKAKAARPQAVKEYKAGATYALGDVVNLNAQGNQLSVEVLPPAQEEEASKDLLGLKLTVSGKLEFLGFTYGGEGSDITLVAGEKTIPAMAARFIAEETVAHGSGLFTHMRTDARDGTLVLDTNEHPLLLLFKVSEEASKEKKRLQLKDLAVGDDKFTLTVQLDK